MKISYPPPAQARIPLSDIVLYSGSETGNISAGWDETVALNPPAGHIYQLLAVGFYVPRPPSSTSGGHVFEVYNTDQIVPVYLEANYDQKLHIQNNEITGTYITSRPNANIDLMSLCRSLWAKNGQPINMKYTNNTDVTQTVGRNYRYWYLDYRV